MLFRERVALTLPALLLRVVVGGTFLWAGLGKLADRADLPPAAAARLAALGAAVTPNPAPPATPPSVAPATSPATPIADGPSLPVLPLPVPPTPLPDPTPAPTHTEPIDTPLPDAPVVDPAPDPLATEPPRATPGQPDGLLGLAMDGTLRLAQNAPGGPTALDFPHGGSAPKAMGLALLLDKAANPGLDDQSRPIRPIWPAALGNGRWPIVLAWAAALTELIAGVLLLLGLFTRPAAMATAGIMLVAAWLTEIGPAWQGGAVVWGLIPERDPWDPAAWKSLLWQLSLLSSSLALALLGSGRLGLDAALFRARTPATAPARRAETP